MSCGHLFQHQGFHLANSARCAIFEAHKPGLEMTNSQIDALIAGSFNLHFGKARQHVMTPAEAAKLSRGDRAALCLVLERNKENGFYTTEEAHEAYVRCVS